MVHRNTQTSTTSVPSAAEPLQRTPASTNSYPGNDFVGTSNAAVKLEWKKAMDALYRGHQDEALRLMTEIRPKFENSALFHRLDGLVAVKAAGMVDDPDEKQELLLDALESATKATLLSPKSIEFAHFYVNLFYGAATDAKDYENIGLACDRALAINMEQEDDEEARIAQMQGELKVLRQKANIASISLWMQTEGPNGSERFRLQRLETNPKPNETRKATRTREERRKYMEDMFAAARTVEQEFRQEQNAEGKIDSD